VLNRSPDEKQTTDFALSWRVLMVASISAALLLFYWSAPLINFLYGAAFAPSIPAVRIIAWIMIPYTINTYLSLTFLATGRERDVARILFVSIIGLLLLNLWWIPRAGLDGACWSALTVEIIQAILFLACWKGKLPSQQPERTGFEHEFSKLSR
jgi:O-antigen/teichoic acid export membrane protein